VIKQLNALFDFKESEIILASAKANIGIPDILNAIVERIPAPSCNPLAPLKALLFDSWFDEYRGVVCLMALKDGSVNIGDNIVLAQADAHYEVLEIGLMYPDPTPTKSLQAGQVGYLITGMKSLTEARVGDTIHLKGKPVEPFPGFKPAKPMVFAGIYPVDAEDFEPLREAIEKLLLNDASVTIEKKTSVALGLGFRCGFLGLLHMDVFKQRLEQEYGLTVIATAPSVLYKVTLKNGETANIESPSDFPDPSRIASVSEPMINATIITPAEYVGSMIKLCEEKRGVQKDFSYMDETRIILKYRLPLNEVATDFYDQLKSASSGYASFDYDEAGYEEADLIKMDILLNGKPVDALSCITHEDKAYYLGRELTEKLKNVIPRQLYEVIIQAAIGSKIIARDRVAPLRKDVTAKCYGGDISRKRKLLEKQKEGKKKMKQVGNVEVPQDAFMTILKK